MAFFLTKGGRRKSPAALVLFFTVLFDMGGTLEDIRYGDQTIVDVTEKLLKIPARRGPDYLPDLKKE